MTVKSAYGAKDIFDLIIEVKLDFKSRRELVKMIQDSMANSLENQAGFFYDEVRNHLIRRFSLHQIAAVKPWDRLPQTKRSEFCKAYLEASEWLSSIGVEDRKKLPLLRHLVRESCLLDPSSLSFSDVTKSVSRIEDLFFKAFPFAHSPESLKFIAANIPDV